MSLKIRKHEWKFIWQILPIVLASVLILIPQLVSAADINIYEQCRNDLGDGPCDWVTGAINPQNSTYYECEAVVFRLHIDKFDPGHSLQHYS